jgi:alpha-tubulin suppressor-like RCC1 family protein
MSLVFSAPLRANRPRRNVVLVATGTSFSTAIDGYGRAWAWGINTNAQLGDGTTSNKLSPVTVAGNKKTFCKIDSGISGSLAIDKYGQVWGWGPITNGQLGINTTINPVITPMSIRGTKKTFCHIAISLGTHSMGIDVYGQIWAWGTGSNGRLGTNSTINQQTPVSLAGAKKTFCKIDTGNAWTAAIDKYGQVWCWGNGGDGRLGRNSTVSFLTPVSIAGQKKTFCHISAGNATTAGIDKYGIIWSWGFNSSGQLGNGANTAVWTPVSLAGARKTFCKINLGNGQTMAIDQYGQAWGWGFNANGLLGNGDFTAKNTPVRVYSSITFCEISAGSQHSIAVDKNKRLWGWGPYSFGQLGNNNTITSCMTPVSVLGAAKTFCQVNGEIVSFNATTFNNNSSNLAIDKNGLIWGWGQNAAGQFGDNSTINRLTPVSVAGAIKTFCAISSGGGHSLAIDKYGRVWAWGSNSNGQIGDNSTINRLTPVSIAGAIKTFCAISGGNAYSLSIDKYGRAWAWGFNNNGQLGDNSVSSRILPVSIAGAIKTFCAIAASNNHSIAIDKYGHVWAWGLNSGIPLGDNSTINRLTPVSVAGNRKTFCVIAAGVSCSLAIDKYGRAWAWGVNSGGQLGDNSTVSRRTPVSVAGAIKTFCAISSGGGHSLAIDKYGRAWAWGGGATGTLGDNSTVNRLTPVSIAGAIKTFCVIRAGSQHSLAIDKYGRAWTWGVFGAGRLGIGKDIFEFTPVKVCNI